MSDSSIKEIRKKRGLTQVQLAQLLGVTQGAVQKLETGENDLTGKMLKKLATILNVEPWELLPKDMQPNISPDEMEIIRAVRRSKGTVVKTEEISSTNKAS